MKWMAVRQWLILISFGGAAVCAFAQQTSTSPSITSTQSAQVVNLISKNSWWRLFDSGSAPLGDWTALEYADSEWRFGPGQFGWGELDEATRLEPGVGSLMRCYFRHQFTLTNVSAFTDLVFEVLRDDGVVVYLNGREAFRMNMPDAGAITTDTFAISTITGADENTYFQWHADGGLLVEGTNIVAVEMHQSSPTAADGSFDLALTAVGAPQLPPPEPPPPPPSDSLPTDLPPSDPSAPPPTDPPAPPPDSPELPPQPPTDPSSPPPTEPPPADPPLADPPAPPPSDPPPPVPPPEPPPSDPPPPDPPPPPSDPTTLPPPPPPTDPPPISPSAPPPDPSAPPSTEPPAPPPDSPETPAPQPTLLIQRSADKLVIRWDIADAILEQASSVGGAWTLVTNAASPYEILINSAANRVFYRVRLASPSPQPQASTH